MGFRIESLGFRVEVVGFRVVVGSCRSREFPRQSLGGGRQKSISPEGSCFQRFTPVCTDFNLAWLVRPDDADIWENVGI